MKFVARPPRVPVYSQLSAGEGLRDCWCLNISKAGIALTGTLVSPTLAAGSTLEIALELSDALTPLRLRVCIEWMQRLPGPPGFENVVLGGSFEKLSAAQLAAIESYVESYRPRIAVLNGSADDFESLRALEPDYDVQEVETTSDLLSGRFSAVLVCGTETNLALALVEVLNGAWRDEHAPLDALRRTVLEPRVIFYAVGEAAAVLALCNGGKIFRSVAPGGSVAELRGAIGAAVEDFAIRSEMQRLRWMNRPAPLTPAAVEQRRRTSVELVAVSESMARVLHLVERAARHRVPVLLTGETGSGKEILARRLHEMSPRAGAAFVVQDCGAVTETLLESELFGHVKGAFTGAIVNHPGLFRMADGGTIFLDEIENISQVFQAKLLRVLETGEVRPVGSTTSVRVDVRVIAATNRNLRQQMQLGTFRADLFYRLDRFTIEVPPLRERRADILPIARHFLLRHAEELSADVTILDPDVEARLLAYDWPGNVRELRNVIERAVLLSEPGPRVSADALPETLRESRPAAPASASLRAQLAEFERSLIVQALRQHGGVFSRAARALKVDAVTLKRRAAKLGVTADAPNDAS